MRWFRFYDDVVNDPKVQKLPLKLFRLWVNLLCIASKNHGTIPCLDDLHFLVRVPVPELAEGMRELTERDLFHIETNGTYTPHNWKDRQYLSDDVTARVRKHREKVKRSGNVPETPSESESESDTEKPSSGGDDKELENAILQVSQNIHARHPEPRRDIGVEGIAGKLRTITRKMSKSERIACVNRIEQNHIAWCSTDQWKKDGGDFAKGLENWLAPTKGRFDNAPPNKGQKQEQRELCYRPGLVM